MTKIELGQCGLIIHAASGAAGAVGTGLAQIPMSDNLVITPIQLAMTISLGKVFGLDLDESAAKAGIASASAAVIGRTVSQVLVGWMPGIGNAINAVTAAGLTETIGWILAKEFAKRSVAE